MTDPNANLSEQEFSRRFIDSALRLGLIALMIGWSFMIFKPFVMPVLWAGIIAVAVQPLYLRFERLLGGRRKLGLILFTLLALGTLLVPTFLLVESTVEAVHGVSEQVEDGVFAVPPPPASVAEWPLVGERVHKVWSGASTNLESTLKQFAPEIKAAGKWVLEKAAGAGGGLLQFVFAIIIAAVFLANSRAIHAFFDRLAMRLAGEQGRGFADLAGATVRSVAQGVLGVAIIQALAAGVGMLAIGVPAAGVWALVVLVLAVIQLPPILILGPVMVWAFSALDTAPAVLFAIWGVLVSGSDAVLKPLFLGRGMDIPMLVILVGALGGMMLSGIIGLFVGAVVLALSYRLFIAWLEPATADTALHGEQDTDRSGC